MLLNQNINSLCDKGDRIVLTYANPRKVDTVDVRSGIVEKVAPHYVCLRTEQHDGAFRSYSRAFIETLTNLS